MIDAIFTTERLWVRHFTPSDLTAFAALCIDPIVMRYMGDGETLPRSEVERWIGICQGKYASRGYGTSAVFERGSGRFVGYCGVVRAPDRDFDEIVYAYHREFWGRGYATEAGRAMLDYVFARSALDAIWATIHGENANSAHVAEKLGMGFVREERHDDGSSTLYYVLHRKEQQ